MAAAAAAAPTRRRAQRWLLPFSLACAALACAVAGLEFRVGGEMGWHLPEEKETAYNQWASRNRFHVGDSLYFKYGNDSVLVVDADGYRHCNTSSPLQEFHDHNTTFEFGRFGYFYFISGRPGHCQAGQKLVVRVMVHPLVASPQPAPAPAPEPGAGGGGSDSGWSPGTSSSPTASSSHKIWVGLPVAVAASPVAFCLALLV